MQHQQLRINVHKAITVLQELLFQHHVQSEHIQLLMETLKVLIVKLVQQVCIAQLEV